MRISFTFAGSCTTDLDRVYDINDAKNIIITEENKNEVIEKLNSGEYILVSLGAAISESGDFEADIAEFESCDGE